MVIPVAALRHSNSGDYVYVLNGDRTVSLRPVQRGQATADKIVITSGLQAGERVVTEGADRLQDGSRVALPGDAPGGPAGRRQRPDGARGPASAPAGAASAAMPLAPSANALPPSPPSTPSTPSADVRLPATPMAASAGPTPEQRRRMLDRVKNDPAALAQRQELLAQIDKGDPAAIARWQAMQQQRRQGDRPAQ